MVITTPSTPRPGLCSGPRGLGLPAAGSLSQPLHSTGFHEQTFLRCLWAPHTASQLQFYASRGSLLGSRGRGQGSESPHPLPNQPLRDQPGFLSTERKGHLLAHLSARMASATPAAAEKCVTECAPLGRVTEGRASLRDPEWAGHLSLHWAPVEENTRRLSSGASVSAHTQGCCLWRGSSLRLMEALGI